MKKLLKIFLPPFIGFLVFSVIINGGTLYTRLSAKDLGLDTLQSFTAFYRYTMPLLFVVAVLTQILIVIPVWRHVAEKTWADRINMIVDLCFVCGIFALGIGYAIWDTQSGTHILIKLVAMLLGIQLAYWFINLLVLFVLD